MIYRLVRSRQLVAQMDGSKIVRVLDPAPALRQQLVEPAIDRFPLISSIELAEVMGVSRESIKWYVFQGTLHPHQHGNQGVASTFTAKEVRRFVMAGGARGVGNPKRDKKIYSHAIVRWLKNYLSQELRPADAIQELIRDLVPLPEPQRSQTIAAVWGHIDAINAILTEAAKKGSSA